MHIISMPPRFLLNSTAVSATLTAQFVNYSPGAHTPGFPANGIPVTLAVELPTLEH